jgi:penicillin-binding protein 1A
MIVKLAKEMGLRTPLADTPSLPIGAGEVTVLDHTVAMATFPNEGMVVAPHAVLEVKTATGELVWRFDRDGPKPRRVIPRQVALEMNAMLNSAAEHGTGRRAMLDGVRIAGKTGTTNAHRDAWFVAFTGNLIGGVWMGNDDYQPMQRMTGGSLPAMTWQAIMTYAHQGIELKNIAGTQPNPPRGSIQPPQDGSRRDGGRCRPAPGRAHAPRQRYPDSCRAPDGRGGPQSCGRGHAGAQTRTAKRPARRRYTGIRRYRHR